MNIAEKVALIKKLADEVVAESTELAKNTTVSRPVTRFFAQEFYRGTTIATLPMMLLGSILLLSVLLITTPNFKKS